MPGEWEDIDEGWEDLPPTRPSPSIARSPAEQSKIAEQQAYAKELEGRGTLAKSRAAEAKSMSLFANPFGPAQSKLAITAGRETDKLLAGAGDIGDFLLDVVGVSGRTASTQARAKSQAEKDRLYREMGENEGMAMLARTAPYLLTGAVGGPAVGRGVGSVLQKAGQATTTAKAGGRGALASTAEYLAARPFTQRLGQRIQTEWVNPMAQAAKGAARRPPIKDLQRPDMLRNILASGALGWVEGGMHYDNNPIEGAIAGLAGGFTGQVIKPFLSRAPNQLGETDAQLIPIAESKGMRFLPGMKTGNRAQQQFEAGIRNDKRTMNFFDQIDEANKSVVNREVFNAMGLANSNVRQTTPEVLKGHMSNLKNQYQELEANSIGKFDYTDLYSLNKEVARLKDLDGPLAKEAAKEAESAYKRIINSITVDESGVASYSGKDYQTMRREIKEVMDTSWDKNKTTYNTMRDVLNTLDNSMERGVREVGGDVRAKDWKTLNEKYAMTKLVLNKGMDIDGSVNGRKLTNHLMSKDAERTLKSEGNRIIKLQQAAKLDNLAQRQEGSKLSSDQILGDNKARTFYDSWIYSPARFAMGPIERLALGSYAKGYPSVTGLFGMSGKDLGDPTLYTRGLSQASQVHPDTVEGIQDTYNTITGSINDARQGLANYFQ